MSESLCAPVAAATVSAFSPASTCAVVTVARDPGPQARRRALDDEFPVEATLLEEAEGQAVEKVRLSVQSSVRVPVASPAAFTPPLWHAPAP